MTQIWYEDFTPGTVLRSPDRLVTTADIDGWAALTGEDHPVHMDEHLPAPQASRAASATACSRWRWSRG